MSKTWGIARFYGMGSMEYLLESEDWLADSKLFDGAPLLLVETMKEADVAAKVTRCSCALRGRSVPHPLRRGSEWPVSTSPRYAEGMGTLP